MRERIEIVKLAVVRGPLDLHIAEVIIADHRRVIKLFGRLRGFHFFGFFGLFRFLYGGIFGFRFGFRLRFFNRFEILIIYRGINGLRLRAWLRRGDRFGFRFGGRRRGGFLFDEVFHLHILNISVSLRLFFLIYAYKIKRIVRAF